MDGTTKGFVVFKTVEQTRGHGPGKIESRQISYRTSKPKLVEHHGSRLLDVSEVPIYRQRISKNTHPSLREVIEASSFWDWQAFSFLVPGRKANTEGIYSACAQVAVFDESDHTESALGPDCVEVAVAMVERRVWFQSCESLEAAVCRFLNHFGR